MLKNIINIKVKAKSSYLPENCVSWEHSSNTYTTNTNNFKLQFSLQAHHKIHSSSSTNQFLRQVRHMEKNRNLRTNTLITTRVRCILNCQVRLYDCNSKVTY